MAAILTAGFHVPVGGYVATVFEGDLVMLLILLSLPTLAHLLTGWLSGNVVSLVGRSSALLQDISYEVPCMMAQSDPAILAGSRPITCIIRSPAGPFRRLLVQPLCFVLSFLGLTGKASRSPLGTPKAKSEIDAGPLTQSGRWKLALWDSSRQVKTGDGIVLFVDVLLEGRRGWTAIARAALLAATCLLVLLPYRWLTFPMLGCAYTGWQARAGASWSE